MKAKKKEKKLTQEESEKIEKEIFPDDEQSVKCDKKTDVLHIIKDWSQIFYKTKSKLMKDRFLKVVSKSKYANFFKALDYEYGINGKPLDLKKAFEMYKISAEENYDNLSMYKLYHIFLFCKSQHN